MRRIEGWVDQWRWIVSVMIPRIGQDLVSPSRPTAVLSDYPYQSLEKTKHPLQQQRVLLGGEGGIRTLEGVAPLAV